MPAKLSRCLVLTGCLLSPFGIAANDATAQPVAPKTKIEATAPVVKIAGDFAFTEGPAVAADGTLYFTDIPNETIHILKPGGKIEAFTETSGHANGLWIDEQDRLLACEMDGQLVAYDRNSKKRTVLADSYEGMRFNAPNDVVPDRRGGQYFTDPLYRAPEPLPQKIQAVYHVSKEGTVTRISDAIAAPNGIGLSPDGKTLYVIPSQTSQMLSFPISEDGSVGPEAPFCQLQQPAGKAQTGGDGMAMDVEGNLYITTELGIQIFNPEGEQIGLVAIPEHPANVTFGGKDRKTMYVTARTGLYSVAMPIAGL
ncbi:Gluconolactonase precursor [Roseimaritima multifibrata]|uniref:Gluconolactonase n=1 Tax=Roseimaritima multifibrata TaxID=1930274 RepID=A0A517MK90_9BACT|nr:SMP-30/gluconolactonase/LRE family protein [Roseimaritima multifibrata]QDS95260.1 Gluconolactonase precursor [Roseimaritima multifibrata]